MTHSDNIQIILALLGIVSSFALLALSGSIGSDLLMDLGSSHNQAVAGSKVACFASFAPLYFAVRFIIKNA